MPAFLRIVGVVQNSPADNEVKSGLWIQEQWEAEGLGV